MSDRDNNEADKHLLAMEDVLAKMKLSDPENSANVLQEPNFASVSETITAAPAADPIVAAPPPVAQPVQQAVPMAPAPTPQQSLYQEPPLSVPAVEPALSSNLPSQQQNSFGDEPVNMRTQQDFSRAHQHSIWVRRFKLILPIAAGFIVVALIGFGLFYRELPDNISVDSAAISDGNLVMDSPNLDGFNDENLPYSVKADRAIQNLKNTDIINLEGIHANLPIDDKNFAKIDANKGIYDNKAQTLKLSEKILLNSTNGFIVTLEEADIDIQKGILRSNAPVSVQSPSGTITAESLEITDNGKRVVFKNKVRLTIQPAN